MISGLPGYSPGSADRNLMGQAFKASEESLVEKAMLEDKIKATGITYYFLLVISNEAAQLFFKF